MNKFKFKLKNGSVKEMDIDELARWACLIEGVEQVAKRYEELGENMDTDDWIKPLAFQKYIEERFHSMKHDLTVEATLGLI
jgi:hypothetical protein